MRSLVQDIRHGERPLLKSRGFTLVAVVTLALEIGANTAVFTLVDSVVLRLRSSERPDPLVAFWTPADWSKAIPQFTRAG